MSEVIVELGYRTYKIIVKDGSINTLQENLDDHKRIKNLVLISHDSLMRFYGFSIKENLEKTIS